METNQPAAGGAMAEELAWPTARRPRRPASPRPPLPGRARPQRSGRPLRFAIPWPAAAAGRSPGGRASSWEPERGGGSLSLLDQSQQLLRRETGRLVAKAQRRCRHRRCRCRRPAGGMCVGARQQPLTTALHLHSGPPSACSKLYRTGKRATAAAAKSGAGSMRLIKKGACSCCGGPLKKENGGAR